MKNVNKGLIYSVGFMLCALPAFGADSWDEEKGIALGTNSHAWDLSSIATGKGSIAVGAGAVATGDNLTKEKLQTLLAENNKKLNEIEELKKRIPPAEREFNRTNEIWLMVTRNDKIIAENRKALKGLNENLQMNRKNYRESKDEYDRRQKDINARLDKIKNLDIELEKDNPDLEALATRLKGEVEQGTAVNVKKEVYRQYIGQYMKLHGEANRAKFASFVGGIIYSGKNDGNSAPLFLQDDMSGSSVSVLLPVISNTNLNRPLEYVEQGRGDQRVDYTFQQGSLKRTGKADYKFSKPLGRYSDDASVTAHKRTFEQYDEPSWNAFLNYIDTKNFDYPWEPQGTNYKAMIKEWAQDNKEVVRAKRELENAQQTYYDASDGEKSAALIKLVAAKNRYNKKVDVFMDKYKDGTHNPFIRQMEDKKAWEAEKVNRPIAETAESRKVINDAFQGSIQGLKDKVAALAAEGKRLDGEIQAKEEQNRRLEPTAEERKEAQRLEEVKVKLDRDRAALEKALKTLKLNDLKDRGRNSMAFGTNALAGADNSIAFGAETVVSSPYSTALGSSNIIVSETGKGNNHVHGNGNTLTDSEDVLVYGNNNIVKGLNHSAVFGSEATMTQNNSLVFGYKSADRPYRHIVPHSVFIRENAGPLTEKELANHGVVSFGSEGAERQLIHVAAGAVTKNSTDAVNGSQLWYLTEDLKKVAGDVKNNANELEKFKPPVFIKGDVTVEGNATAKRGLTIKGDTDAQGNVAVGKNLTVKGDTNVQHLTVNKTLTVKEKATFHSDVQIRGKLKAKGLDAGGYRITNVGNPQEGSDAVNLQTLKTYVGDGLTNTEQSLKAELSAAKKELKGQIAATGAKNAALASMHPLGYDKRHPTGLTAALGHQDGETALALGLWHYRDEDTLYNLSASYNNGLTVALGASYRFGKSEDEREVQGDNLSVEDLRQENETLKKRLSDVEVTLHQLIQH